jgi:transposase InsO family protein
MTELCREFGISRTTGYTWLERYENGGAPQVVEKSRRPLHSPRRTPAEIEAAIVELRRQWPDWGAPKLAHLFQQQHPERAPVCIRTVHRIRGRHGLIEPHSLQGRATERFERSAPNELWQMDFKGPQGFNRATAVGPLSILDDHSRYLLALQHLGSTRMSGVKSTLEATFDRAGVPEQMLVDHGIPWWNAANAVGLSELSVWMMRQGVRLWFSGIRHPQTQGKVERMHGALQRAIRRRKQDPEQQPWLDAFRHEYNHVRPHAGIGMATPASRWQPSARSFHRDPREWEYDRHKTVVRLAGQGQLWWSGRRYEISRALRGQLVGLELLGERALVYFCRTPLRELDLRTGRSFPIPIDVAGFYSSVQGKGPQPPAPFPALYPRSSAPQCQGCLVIDCPVCSGT